MPPPVVVLTVSFALGWHVVNPFTHRPPSFGPYQTNQNVTKTVAVSHRPRLWLPMHAVSTVTSLQPSVNCAKVACVALTFDDGPNPIGTPIVLQALEQAQVHATFFVVGSRAITMPSLLQRMYDDGDEIGDHSWSHPDMTTLTAAEVDAQISMTQTAVTAAGVPAPTLFRPPYGAINAVMQSQIHLPFILWNDDPKDWQSQNPPAIITSAEAQVQAGSIIEMHDIYPTTGEAMPQLISDLKQHYQLVTITQLLDLPPGATGEYFSR
jgi:peptidoglycan-N-acetylglucosamine deacetylase